MTDAPAKSKGGRPKGYPRSGGRKRGTPNKDRAFTVKRIETEADPVGLLIKVCRGDRMSAGAEPGAKSRSWWFPSSDQRLQAATVLARKVLPDQKAIESTGPQGEPITVRINL